LSDFVCPLDLPRFYRCYLMMYSYLPEVMSSGVLHHSHGEKFERFFGKTIWKRNIYRQE